MLPCEHSHGCACLRQAELFLPAQRAGLPSSSLVTAEGLLPFGYSKDDETRLQIKVMMGSLGPLGMPLATDVLTGERADDVLYLALLERIRPNLKTVGLLF